MSYLILIRDYPIKSVDVKIGGLYKIHKTIHTNIYWCPVFYEIYDDSGNVVMVNADYFKEK